MAAYYNENDKKAAAVLRELIRRNAIAPGEVDERSIEDVAPDDLVGFAQCHFFAGFGVWSYALRLAGVSDDEALWTGSCPCQPYSSAGKGDGFDDERHLWPAWFHLIRERRPAKILGEQVANKRAEPWIDLVHADLEGVDYAYGCVPFPAAGVGSPNVRDRAYWVADADRERFSRIGLQLLPRQCGQALPEAAGRGEVGGMADDAHERHERGGATRRWRDGSSNLGAACGLGDADGSRGPVGLPESPQREGGLAGVADDRGRECTGAGHGPADSGVACGEEPGPTNGFWRASDWLFCRDELWRPVEPGTFPLVDGADGRLVRLRGYGNAINAYAAKAFIEAYLEVTA